MTNDGVKVWWCSKTVTGGPAWINWLTRLGNHHFIMIQVDLRQSKGAKPSTNALRKTNNRLYAYMTLSVQDEGMSLHPNGHEDILTVKKWFDNAERYLRFDLNQVPPPSGSNMDFANNVLRIARQYNHNLKSNRISYDFISQNCATVVNSLFKAAGVPAGVRHRCGEFNQLDWGEEAELSMQLFM